jgi:hypothetical protein
VTKASLQAAGVVAKARRRGAHCNRREGRSLLGRVLFQNGSTHRWIAGLGRDLDFVVTLEDATLAVCSALLVEQEGTMSSLLGLAETITRHGLFGPLYSDRGGLQISQQAHRGQRTVDVLQNADIFTRYGQDCVDPDRR